MKKQIRIEDERIREIRHKIVNEAFAIMFFALWVIVMVKGLFLHLPTGEYLTEFILVIGISLYIYVRMIVTGIFGSDLQSASRGQKLKRILVIMLGMGVGVGISQAGEGELNILRMAIVVITGGALTYLMLYIVKKINDRKIAEMERQDKEEQ